MVADPADARTARAADRWQRTHFPTWFYDRPIVTPNAIEGSTVDEYLRTFSGVEGVLGALGVYRAAFTTIEQTTPLMKEKLSVSVVAIEEKEVSATK
jgi:hypothetical protein